MLTIFMMGTESKLSEICVSGPQLLAPLCSGSGYAGGGGSVGAPCVSGRPPGARKQSGVRLLLPGPQSRGEEQEEGLVPLSGNSLPPPPQVAENGHWGSCVLRGVVRL